MMTCGTWDLEERVEDAFVALLKASAPTQCAVYAGLEIAEPSYPLVVVHVESSGQPNETGRFTGKRKMAVIVHIVTEAVNQHGAQGSPEANQTARQAHRAFKSAILDILSGNELQTELNDVGQEGVAFSFAMMAGQRREAEGMYLTTHQTIDVIAQPKVLGG